MSKYKELLDRIDQRNYLTEREHREFLEELQEAIDKIEKYDEINKVVIGEGYATDDDTTDKEKIRNVFSDIHDLVFENQKLKQQKEHYKAMVKKAVKENPLREPYDELLKENQILKDGVKAITSKLNIKFSNIDDDDYKCNYITFYDNFGNDLIEFGDNADCWDTEDYNKIKAMLEVVDNE